MHQLLICSFIKIIQRDGSVSVGSKGQYRVQFVGPKLFLECLKSTIQKLADVNGGSITTKCKIFDLCFNGNVISRSVLTTLYEGSTKDTRLSRKYDIYEKLLTKVKSTAKPWKRNDYSPSFFADLDSEMSAAAVANKYGYKVATVRYTKKKRAEVTQLNDSNDQ